VIDKEKKHKSDFVLTPKELQLLEDTEYWMISPTLLKIFNSHTDKGEDSQSDCEISGEESGWL